MVSVSTSDSQPMRIAHDVPVTTTLGVDVASPAQMLQSERELQQPRRVWTGQWCDWSVA